MELNIIIYFIGNQNQIKKNQQANIWKIASAWQLKIYKYPTSKVVYYFYFLCNLNGVHL